MDVYYRYCLVSTIPKVAQSLTTTEMKSLNKVTVAMEARDFFKQQINPAIANRTELIFATIALCFHGSNVLCDNLMLRLESVCNAMKPFQS